MGFPASVDFLVFTSSVSRGHGQRLRAVHMVDPVYDAQNVSEHSRAGGRKLADNLVHHLCHGLGAGPEVMSLPELPQGLEVGVLGLQQSLRLAVFLQFPVFGGKFFRMNPVFCCGLRYRGVTLRDDSLMFLYRHRVFCLFHVKGKL